MSKFCFSTGSRVLSVREIRALVSYLCGNNKKLPNVLKKQSRRVRRGRPCCSAIKGKNKREATVQLIRHFHQTYYDAQCRRYCWQAVSVSSSAFCAIVYLLLTDNQLLHYNRYADYHRLLCEAIDETLLPSKRAVNKLIASVCGFGKSLTEITPTDLLLPATEFTPISPKQHQKWLTIYHELQTNLNANG